MRLAIVLAAVLFPTVASAQSLELFAATGLVSLWNDESNLGIGAPVGVGIGFRSPYGWGVEGLVEAQQSQRHFPSPNDVRFDSSVTAATARLLKYFSREPTQLYVGAGFGLTRVKSTFNYPAGCALGPNNQFQCSARDVQHSTSSSGTLSGVAGVRMALRRGLFVRPEFELSRGGEHMRIGGTVAVGASW